MTATVAGAHHHFLQGRQSAAEAICRDILSVRRNDPPALQLLAMMAQSQGRLAVALKLAQMAVAGGPGVAEFWNTLGAVLGDLRRWDEAVAAFDAAVRLRPDYVEALRNLGVALGKLRRYGAQLDTLRRVVELRPDDADAWGLLAELHQLLFDVREMIACRRRVHELRPELPYRHSELLDALHYDAAVSPDDLFREHVAWGNRFAEPHHSAWREHENDRNPDRRLRVGYVSAGFRNHPVARFHEAAMAARDRSAYHLICYANVAKPDKATARIRALADEWRDVIDLTDDQLAEQIRADRIDILVDLDGHDFGNRLTALARKPAPVQATMTGYMNGTGMSAMDWRITDAWHDPPGMTEHHLVERLYRLPGGIWCYTPDAEEAEPMQAGSPHRHLPAERNGFVTFGSLNRLIKASDPCLRLWARVIAATPGSRLLLATPGGTETHAYISHVLARHGVDPARVDLVPRAPTRAEYLSRLRRIDIVLDSFPFNGMTTTADALWMGVPVVSLAGAHYASRAGASMLNAIGAAELLATDADGYVAVATRLATDLARLSGFRKRLCDSRTAAKLYDGRRLAIDLAQAYRQMWRDWCKSSRRALA